MRRVDDCCFRRERERKYLVLKRSENVQLAKTQNSYVDGNRPSLASFRRIQSKGPFWFPRNFSRNEIQPLLLKCSLYFSNDWSVKEGREVYKCSQLWCRQRIWEGQLGGRPYHPCLPVVMEDQSLQSCSLFSF